MKPRIMVTAETAAELKRLGYRLPVGIEVGDTGEKAWGIICPVYAGGTLILPDNKVALCSGTCGRLVQHRPHIPKVPVVCMECAAEFYKAHVA